MGPNSGRNYCGCGHQKGKGRNQTWETRLHSRRGGKQVLEERHSVKKVHLKEKVLKPPERKEGVDIFAAHESATTTLTKLTNQEKNWKNYRKMSLQEDKETTHEEKK